MYLSSYYAQQVHREWLARFEREAELRRRLPTRPARRLRGSGFLTRGAGGSRGSASVAPTRTYPCP